MSEPIFWENKKNSISLSFAEFADKRNQIAYRKREETYGKCSKILNSNLSEKMANANSTDPNQTA